MPNCDTYHARFFRDFRSAYLWASELGEGKGTSFSFDVKWDSEALAWKATARWTIPTSNREDQSQ